MIFYEIDPLVAQIAKDTRYFHYLSQAKATLAIHILDARAGIRQIEDHSLDILIQDAFSSDAIPFHLLTAEAFALYARKLKPKGIWVFHITNHFIDLEPALAEQFASMGMIARIQAHQPPAKQRFHFPSRWVVATKAHAPLASLWKDSRWRPLQRRRGFQLWTDQRSSLLSVLQYPWSKSYKKRAHKKKTK